MPERRRTATERPGPPERRTVTERRPTRSGAETTSEDRLRAWIRSVDPEAEVVVGPPSDRREGRGVNVYLLDISPQPPARGTARPPLQLWLRYLLSTWAADQTAADRLLVELGYAAIGETDLEVDPAAPSPETWIALQAVARPSFIVRVTARRTRTRPAAPLVLHPLRLQPAPPSLVAGIVRGPGAVPLPDVVVAIPSIDRETRTDRNGRFVLAGVPGPPLSTHLLVRAKGTETLVKLPKDPARARALVIEITTVEGANA